MLIDRYILVQFIFYSEIIGLYYILGSTYTSEWGLKKNFNVEFARIGYVEDKIWTYFGIKFVFKKKWSKYIFKFYELNNLKI